MGNLGRGTVHRLPLIDAESKEFLTMLSNRLAFVALAIACLGAAAGGGYLATRQNVVPSPMSAEMQPLSPAPSAPAASSVVDPSATPSAPAPQAVQETEATVGDRTPSTPTLPTPAPPRTPSARREEARADASRAARQPAPAPRSAATVARQEQPPPLTSTWPSSASTQPPAAPAPPTPPEAPAPSRPDDRAVQETPREPERAFEELVVSADSVIGLQTETRITSETARVEDRVEARVTREVKVGDRVAIPAGARALGSVMQVERGGKFKERARLGIRFHTLVLADGTRVPISTETIYRDGEAPGNSTAAKVGGAAVGGAILGAILGGAKGAVIGSTAGAGAGTAVVMAGDRNAATLPAGTPMTIRLLSPVTVTSEK
jgi:hypothetical protein